MMVLFVSQCEKKALKKTRRVLDAFADRIGDNTWQTVITEDGLQAVKKLLCQSASKNSAVSCHWIRSRARSDLLWVVGNKRKFDYRGVVAVNRTKRNILHNDWESNWQYASSIQIIATIAALLHDIGKSTDGFQHKLRNRNTQGDPYRHEWISLKLFELLIQGCKTDKQWLQRFSQIDDWLVSNPIGTQLSQNEKDKPQIGNMPPLAQWVAWLIISHHRLPPFEAVYFKNETSKENLKSSKSQIKPSLGRYYQRNLKAFDFWVKNPTSLELATAKVSASFWQCKQLVLHSKLWQKQIKRWSRKALNETTLINLSEQALQKDQAISDAFLLFLSRLSLMVGDHNYSSLKPGDKNRLQGAEDFSELAANTDRETKKTKQALDEHLLGVAGLTAKFARNLPIIAQSLPALKNQRALEKHTSNKRFKWQNKAYSTSQNLQEQSHENGFFGVNMASTGCGKTIGNARIMYALSDPKKGARFTIALGLRILTLQTGLSFRKDLNLTAEQLAILVGGQANKKLFEINQIDHDNSKIKNESDESNENQMYGSESDEELLDGWVDSEIDYSDYDELSFGTVVESKKARDLLFSPIVTCTVDHIIQASECKRGGQYIAPMLRLLSGDLILDEPDDFDQADLPALSRLVHLAGLFGSRVLLSSATLTPDLVVGLFKAYQTGRELFNNSQNKAKPSIVCAWFDEQEQAITSTQCKDSNDFSIRHDEFARKREIFLSKQPVRRKADILPLTLSYKKEQSDNFYAELAQTILNGALKLHHDHHQVDLSSHKQVSIGLVRIANIKNITQIAMQLFNQVKIPDDVHIHLSCYHAKQLLILRSSLENKLDRILSRDSTKPEELFTHTEVQEALQKSPAKKHVFIVLATPVAEVGRDHDYDWAIVEPSSMRSIIQLAGRIWRHRPDKLALKTNMLILQYNIRKFTRRYSDFPVFTKPGFETNKFKPSTYDAKHLITPDQLAQVDAKARIIKPKHEAILALSDLEHQVMQDLLNNENLNYVNAYWDESATANRVHTHLQQISQFRAGIPQEDWMLVPNEQSKHGFDAYYAQDVYDHKLLNATPQPQLIQKLEYRFEHQQISPWLVSNLTQDLELIRKQGFDEQGLNLLATQYATVSLESERNGWSFHEFFGFIKN